MCIIPMKMEYFSFSREVSQVDKYITKNVDLDGRISVIYSDFLYPKGSSCEVFYGETEKNIKECVSPEAASVEEEEFHLSVLSIKVNRNSGTGGIHANRSYPTFTYPNKLITLF